MKKLHIKRIAIPLVCVLICLFAVSAVTASGDVENTPKEEVVYFALGDDGATASGYIVNVFELFEDAPITDYGKYGDIKMLNEDYPFSQSGDRITIEAQKGTLFYQGDLTEVQNPWLVSIRYYLDGTELSAAELAGKSGFLEIKIDVSQNEACGGSYYDDLALQVSATLDAEKCDNIHSDTATIANAGSSKQVTWTALPGSGLSATVSADVRDFSMGGVNINGVQMNLDFDFDTGDFTGQFDELEAAIAAINSAAQELKTGAYTLYGGTGDLQAGMDTLDSSVATLNSAIKEINGAVTDIESGAQELQSGLGTADESGKTIREGSAEILLMLETLNTELQAFTVSTGRIGELATASTGIKSAIGGLYGGIRQLQTMLAAYNSADTAALIERLDTWLDDHQNTDPGYAEISASHAALSNMAQLLDGVKTAVNPAATPDPLQPTLYELAATLNSDYEQFDEGIQAIPGQLAQMSSGVSRIRGAINALTAEYSKFDAGLEEYLSGLTQITVGYDKLYRGIAALAGGMDEYAGGMNKLKSGTNQMLGGSGELHEGMGDYADGMSEFAGGTAELYKETRNMGGDVQQAIDDAIGEMSGSGKIQSFASPKNTHINSVQFIMISAAVELPTAAAEPEPEPEQRSMLDRFVDLFR